jgi:hypothetical protein
MKTVNILGMAFLLACHSPFTMAKDSEPSVTGNGGGAITCRNSKGKLLYAQIYDLWEGSEQGVQISLYSEAKKEYHLQRALDALEQYSPIFFKDFYPFLEKIEFELQNSIGHNKGKNLTVPQDRGPLIMLPNECPHKKMSHLNTKYETIVNWQSNDQIHTNSEIYLALSGLNQAAIILHEALYAVYRSIHKFQESELVYHQTSEPIRQLTARLLSSYINPKGLELSMSLFLKDKVSYYRDQKSYFGEKAKTMLTESLHILTNDELTRFILTQTIPTYRDQKSRLIDILSLFDILDILYQHKKINVMVALANNPLFKDTLKAATDLFLNKYPNFLIEERKLTALQFMEKSKNLSPDDTMELYFHKKVFTLLGAETPNEVLSKKRIEEAKAPVDQETITQISQYLMQKNFSQDIEVISYSNLKSRITRFSTFDFFNINLVANILQQTRPDILKELLREIFIEKEHFFLTNPEHRRDLKFYIYAQCRKNNVWVTYQSNYNKPTPSRSKKDMETIQICSLVSEGELPVEDARFLSGNIATKMGMTRIDKKNQFNSYLDVSFSVAESDRTGSVSNRTGSPLFDALAFKVEFNLANPQVEKLEFSGAKLISDSFFPTKDHLQTFLFSSYMLHLQFENIHRGQNPSYLSNVEVMGVEVESITNTKFGFTVIAKLKTGLNAFFKPKQFNPETAPKLALLPLTFHLALLPSDGHFAIDYDASVIYMTEGDRVHKQNIKASYAFSDYLKLFASFEYNNVKDGKSQKSLGYKEGLLGLEFNWDGL